ncbi:unnamed protein product [Mycena citricolor]|uniref:F-box domain-containing protein n=1 Tax=Mycena citricolor TaxID=2018698 RepID=A0AAD2GXX3_9AGAR|nr:unnamed protein product [Mycena citricolor]
MDKKPAGISTSLLSSNAPPSEADAASLHIVLAHLGKQLAGIDESIARLQLHLRELQKTRQGVLEDVKRVRTVLSPIRRLPPEILCDIFALCIPSETSTSFRGKHLKFPWVATRVCRSWRDAGAANAAFWCRVDSGTPLPVVRLQLERSRQCALDIDVGFADCEILGLVAGHSEQWETVSIAASANMLPILDSVWANAGVSQWPPY